METVTREQIRRFRLHTHHLDRWYNLADAVDIAGACGLQNSPPGAWESALRCRIQGFGADDAKRLLEEDKTLLQAWSFRGAPVVFPTVESDAFLSALVPGADEPWIYTRGIQLALDYLGMPFDDLLLMLRQVMPKLDGVVLKSKTALDQTLAQWVAPLLPDEKRALWEAPSMYGSPDKQTVGGAVVSFLLRPFAFMGLVVFGRREGTSPTFTSYKGWLGHPLGGSGLPAQKLARKYLHCFAPASPTGFGDWLGCSPAQAKRMWQTVADEIEAVSVAGRERYVLAADRALLAAPPQPRRQAHLLPGHDPYLGLQDREVILEDKARQRQVWQTVSNPGAVLWQGAVAGIWKARKKGKVLDMELTLWGDATPPQKELQELCEAHAAQQGLALGKITFL